MYYRQSHRCRAIDSELKKEKHLNVTAMETSFPYSGDLNNDPDIYHILSSSTAGSNGHGYKQVWLTTGGNNPSYPYQGGDNPVPPQQWESFQPDAGFEKIDLKNAFFDTSIKTFGSSPNQAKNADNEFVFMKDSQGYTWFYGTIFQQAFIPDGLFPGIDPFYAAATQSLDEGQMSMLVNDKNQYEIFPEKNSDGEKITYYFIEDPWGNEYLAQGTNTSDVDSSKPGSAKSLSELFSSSVLPDGWKKTARELDKDFVLEPATGDDGTYQELKYNSVSDHQDILYYQVGWSTSGKLPAMMIQGMPAWNNDEDGQLIGSKIADDMHGAGGNDLLKGKKGDDMLFGDAGGDTLKGGKGDDIISGGDGKDYLYGGPGINTFGDEKDGNKDVIVITNDFEKPDLISGMDKKDRLFIRTQKPETNGESIQITPIILPSFGDALMISIEDQGIAYYTGKNLTATTLGEMVSIL